MKTDASTLSQTESETKFMSMYVHVTPEGCIEDIYEEDRDALGTYEVIVPRSLSPSLAAAAALGAYHSEVPIKYLWGFDFVVLDENGREVTPDYDVDCYDIAEEYNAKLN
jgi:hypothetical protein